MVASWSCGWPRVVYGGGPVIRRALKLLHESDPLVIGVSFGVALCMVVLATLHREDSKGVLMRTYFRGETTYMNQIKHIVLLPL